MSKPALSTVASKKPRETAGSAAFRAFDYQVNVSMALALELHRQGKQFVAVFDHHDDLVLFVEQEDNSELSFYQIKSSSELTWTTKRLSKRNPTGELPKSIVGKAYYNVARFGAEIRRASILSNRPLNATLATATTTALHDGELSLADLCDDEQSTLIKALEADFPGSFDKSHVKLLTFERVPFDPDSYRATVLGRIVKILEELHPEFVACSSPFYEALLAAVGECTGNVTQSTTVEELLERVALRHSDISRMIIRVQNRSKNLVEWWPSVQVELFKEGKQVLHVQRIKNRCLSYANTRRTGDRAALKLSAAIKDAITKTAASDMDSISDAVTALRAYGLEETSTEPYDLQSAMIVELMESMQ